MGQDIVNFKIHLNVSRVFFHQRHHVVGLSNRNAPNYPTSCLDPHHFYMSIADKNRSLGIGSEKRIVETHGVTPGATQAHAVSSQ